MMCSICGGSSNAAPKQGMPTTRSNRKEHDISAMGPSSDPKTTADDIGLQMGRDYFEARRARVDDFVARHFTWPGTLRLHGAAMGGDILLAPINVMLSPVFVLTRIAAFICRWIGLRRVAKWLSERRILLRTSVARRVEICIVTDLLDLSMPKGARARDPDALSRAILAAPQFRELIRSRRSASEAHALGQRIAEALGDYAGTRSAVAEITTALIALSVGAIVFHALTPGMVSMAPGIADAMARTTAISQFPMGQTLGGVWYGMFPTGASPTLVAATLAGLVMIGSIVAAFAGILADPVQSRLGIHRRRLFRLIDTLEDQLCGPGGRPFAAREHYYARLLDVWDAGASVLRIFRN